MPRLFVAVDLSDEAKEALADMCYGVPGARWVRREQMHLTLRFIGEVHHARADKIKTALKSVQAAPFDLQLHGVGRFPPGKQGARVLWAGIDNSPELKALHAAVEDALAGIGYAREQRPFRAHITLARLKPAPPHPVNRFLNRHAAFAHDAIPVRECILFSSSLHPEGAQYRHEAVYPLAGA